MNIVFWILIIALLAVVWVVLFPGITLLYKMLFKVEREWENTINEDKMEGNNVEEVSK